MFERISNSIKNNFKLKLFSVLVGFVMWTLVIGDLNPVVSRNFENVPIKILNQASLEKNKLILVETNITTVNVEVSGTRNDILKLNRSDILAEATLSDSYNSGTHRLALKVSTPLSTVKVKPSEHNVSVTLDHEISKDFEVVVEIIGNPKNINQVVTNKTPGEKTVTVSGAASVLSKVKKVVATVDISEMEKDEVVNSKLVAYDEFNNPIKNLTLKNEDTTVSVSFSHFKEVPIEFSTINKIDDEIKLLKSEIVPKVVSVVGRQDALDKVDKVSTKNFDLSQVKETGVYPITLDLPNDVSIVNTDTKFVVNIDVDRKIEKVIKIQKIDIKGIVETEKTYRNNIPATVEIKVKGFESVISKLNSSNVKLFIKLTESGDKVTSKIQMEAIEGVELISINPDVINFTKLKD